MTLEGLICKRIEDAVADHVTTYMGKPAVFWQHSPHTKDEGWDDNTQYPRVDYLIDLQASPERQTSGVLTIHIWCIQGDIPEIMEKRIRNFLSGMFFYPDNRMTYALGWSKSDVFEHSNQLQAGSRVVGISMSFDLFCYPYTESTDPDPIAAIYHYIKCKLPQIKRIGQDDFKDYYSPTIKAPALYFHCIESHRTKETNTVLWMEGTLAGHLFAPEQDVSFWVKHIQEELALDGEILMLDGSPMTFISLETNNIADPLRTGQMKIGIRYGVLRKLCAGMPVQSLKIKEIGG